MTRSSRLGEPSLRYLAFGTLFFANWLLVEPRGVSGRYDNVGVRLRVVTGGRSQFRQISAGKSYLSEGEPSAWFGLRHHSSADTLDVLWPGGHQRLLTDVPDNQRLEVDVSK